MKNKLVSKIGLVTIVFVLISTICVISLARADHFKDVSEKDWYAESVEYAYNNNLMNGTSADTFEPEIYITRGMIVTIIYRMENSPKAVGELQFSDVEAAFYYANPIVWATENKIVNGYDADTFAPEDKITREQFAAILCRYAKYKGIDVSVDENIGGKFSAYSDSDKISDYAKDSMLWANSNKLITGVTSSTLVPQGIATRAQAATVFMRFDKLLKNANDEIDISENSENEDLNKSDNIKDEYRGDSNVLPNYVNSSQNLNDSNENKENEKTDIDNNVGEWDSVGSQNIESNKGNVDNEELIFEEPTLVVGSVSVQSGEEASVFVSVKNNPGIAGATVKISFDPRLVLKEACKADALSELDYTAPGKFLSPCNFTWDSEDGQSTEDGEFLKLSFIVPQNAEKGDSFYVDCSYRYGDIFDEDWNDIEFKIINGKITVK